MPRIVNGHLVKFHLDSRLTKLETKWKAIQLLQNELLDRFNNEHPPIWVEDKDVT